MGALSVGKLDTVVAVNPVGIPGYWQTRAVHLDKFARHGAADHPDKDLYVQARGERNGLTAASGATVIGVVNRGTVEEIARDPERQKELEMLRSIKRLGGFGVLEVVENASMPGDGNVGWEVAYGADGRALHAYVEVSPALVAAGVTGRLATDPEDIRLVETIVKGIRTERLSDDEVDELLNVQS